MCRGYYHCRDGTPSLLKFLSGAFFFFFMLPIFSSLDPPRLFAGIARLGTLPKVHGLFYHRPCRPLASMRFLVLVLFFSQVRVLMSGTVSVFLPPQRIFNVQVFSRRRASTFVLFTSYFSFWFLAPSTYPSTTIFLFCFLALFVFPALFPLAWQPRVLRF